MAKVSLPIWERFELDYFRRLARFRAVKRWLSVACAVLAIAWIGLATVRDDETVFRSGPMATAHGFFADDCTKCHAVPWRGLHVLTEAQDADCTMNEACLRCHGNSIGYDPKTMAARHYQPDKNASVPHAACHDCHIEHEGATNLAAVGSDRCTECHKDLRSVLPKPLPNPLRSDLPKPTIRPSTTAFHDDHLEFLTENHTDPGTIKLNHELHLKEGLKGLKDGIEKMNCADCHRAGRSTVPWPYGRPNPHENSFGAAAKGEPHLQAAYMEPIRYSLHCVQCHELNVDSPFDRFGGGAIVPHDSPQAIRTFMRGHLAAYIQKNPKELAESRERDLERRPGLKELLPDEENRLVLEWVEEELGILEQKMYHAMKMCVKCHEEGSEASGMQSLPKILEPQIPSRWFSHSSFDHAQHRVLDCLACHEQATTSTLTRDVLLPGIETCRQCHAPTSGRGNSAMGGVADGCVTCHTYHQPPAKTSTSNRPKLP